MWQSMFVCPAVWNVWTDFNAIFRTFLTGRRPGGDILVMFWISQGPLTFGASIIQLLHYVTWFSPCCCFCSTTGGSSSRSGWAAGGAPSSPTALLVFNGSSRCSCTFYSYYLTLDFHRCRGLRVSDLQCGSTYHTDKRLKDLLVMDASFRPSVSPHHPADGSCSQ